MTCYHLLISYGSHKYTVEIDEATATTSNDVRLLLCERHLPSVPLSWIRLMGKGGKELQKTDHVSSFAKLNKKTKLKLLFSSEFGQLPTHERERRLNGGPNNNVEVETNTNVNGKTGETKIDDSTLLASPPSPPEVEPESWVVSVLVKHAKQKHVLYFTDAETANVGGLRTRLAKLTGVEPNRQRLVVSGKVIGMGANAKSVDESEALLSLSKGKKKLKIKLLFDSKHHHAVASTLTLGDVRTRLNELEKIVGGMHRKMQHNFFDEAQMIVEGRSFDHEIQELEKSVDRLPKAEAAMLKDVAQRVEALRVLSSEIEKMMKDAMRR